MSQEDSIPATNKGFHALPCRHCPARQGLLDHCRIIFISWYRCMLFTSTTRKAHNLVFKILSSETSNRPPIKLAFCVGAPRIQPQASVDQPFRFIHIFFFIEFIDLRACNAEFLVAEFNRNSLKRYVIILFLWIQIYPRQLFCFPVRISVQV